MTPTTETPSSILVVEDDELVRKVIVRKLTRAGFHVLEAACGREALERLGTSSLVPRLLISDMVMPDMSARDLTVQVVERCPAIKVIYMSGYPDHILHARGDLNVTDHFIEKSVLHTSLMTKVQEVLSSV